MSGYDDDIGAYDNLKNRDGTRTTGPQGGGPHPGPGQGGLGDKGGPGPRPGGNNGNDDGPDAYKPDTGLIKGGGGTTGGSTGGTGSSYGGSGYSSGSGASGMSYRDSRLIQQAENVYYQLWGEYPASGYAQTLVKKGLNIFEIEDHERRKPAFKRTETYQNEYMAYAKMVASIMGTR